ncbi:MAG: hypothetical protein M3461_15695 [Pseudomonadota bacterium]|nr:hypothetical protein [Pseudomonadota bacterium]
MRDAVTTLIPIERLRWIGFSHFEADECGSLADWQRLAPHSTALASIIAKVVSVDDSAALRPARGLSDDDIFTTGTYRFRFLQTPHVPHTWEAGMLFEETHATLFCSDLFHHNGNVAPTTSSDVVDLFRQKLAQDGAHTQALCGVASENASGPRFQLRRRWRAGDRGAHPDAQGRRWWAIVTRACALTRLAQR